MCAFVPENERKKTIKMMEKKKKKRRGTGNEERKINRVADLGRLVIGNPPESLTGIFELILSSEQGVMNLFNHSATQQDPEHQEFFNICIYSIAPKQIAKLVCAPSRYVVKNSLLPPCSLLRSTFV